MKSFQLVETKHPLLKRWVDRNGDWEHYNHSGFNINLNSVTSILSKGYPKGQAFMDWLSKHTEEEQDTIKNEAADRGDLVHRTIDLLLSGEGEMTIDRQTEVFSRVAGQEIPLDNRGWDNLLAFQRFWNAHEPIVYVSEAALYKIDPDKQGGYAGTTDAVLKLTKTCSVKACNCADLVGEIGVWDWKTSKAVYPNYGAQVAAYAFADNITEYCPDRPVYGAALALGTKHVTTGGYAFTAWVGKELREQYGAFRAARRLANLPAFNPKKDVVDIPDEVKIMVQHYVASTQEEEIETLTSTNENNA